MTQVLEYERFADLLAATLYAMQHGGDVEVSEDGAWWLVVRAQPDYYSIFDPCPFMDDMVEVEEAAR